MEEERRGEEAGDRREGRGRQGRGHSSALELSLNTHKVL